MQLYSSSARPTNKRLSDGRTFKSSVSESLSYSIRQTTSKLMCVYLKLDDFQNQGTLINIYHEYFNFAIWNASAKITTSIYFSIHTAF